MRLWNLSELSNLEDSVLQPYPEHGAKRLGARLQPRKPSQFRIAVNVAALSLSFSIPYIHTTATTLTLPHSAVAIAQSIAEPQAPLDREFFQGRFNDQWRLDLENELLLRLETGRLEGNAKPLAEQTVDTVFSNQHEDLSETTNRMSREQIAKLVRSRKMA